MANGLTSAEARPPTPTQEIRAVQTKQFEAQREGAHQLQNKGLNLNKEAGKKPSEIIATLNEKGAGWQDSEATQEYVQGAMGFYAEVQAKMSNLVKQAQKEGKPLVEVEAQALAEKQVLESRIRKEQVAERKKRKEQVGTASNETSAVGVEFTSADENAGEIPKTPEQIEADKKAAADQAEKKKIVDATEEWVEKGEPADMARPVLGVIAAETAVVTAKKSIEDAKKDINGDSTQKQVEAARKNIAHEEQVLEAAQKDLDAQIKEVERIRKDPKALDKDRLLAYDIDMVYVERNLSDANDQVLRCEAEVASASPEKKARAEASLKIVEANKATLEAKKTTLKTEREKIGTQDERDVNYLGGIVKTVVKDLPRPVGETEDQKNAAMRHQEAAIDADPLGFLQSQISNPDNFAIILKNSNMSEKDQKRMREIASAEMAEKDVRNKDVKDKVLGTGKTSLLALLMLIYTAYGANKKAKGGQMG